MWMNIAAGVFSVPTTTLPAYTLENRLYLLRTALQRLERYRAERIAAAPGPRWTTAAGRPSMILVAPEYMFVREGFKLADARDLKRNRFLEVAQRESVLASLQAISAHYGRQLVFVPGSIASREVLPAPGTADREHRVDIARQHIVDNLALVQARLQDPLNPAPLEDIAEAQPLLGHQPITPREKLARLEAARRTHKANYYLAENVAYLFHNGRMVAHYAKRGDYHERLPEASPRTIFVPGIAPGRATVGGINFGIEICLDHALGALKHTAAITPDLPRVHLICSAAVEGDATSVLVRDGGYLLHASSDPDATMIVRRNGANWSGPADAENVQVGGFPLRLGTIELDI